MSSNANACLRCECAVCPGTIPARCARENFFFNGSTRPVGKCTICGGDNLTIKSSASVCVCVYVWYLCVLSCTVQKYVCVLHPAVCSHYPAHASEFSVRARSVQQWVWCWWWGSKSTCECSGGVGGVSVWCVWCLISTSFLPLPTRRKFTHDIHTHTHTGKTQTTPRRRVVILDSVYGVKVWSVFSKLISFSQRVQSAVNELHCAYVYSGSCVCVCITVFLTSSFVV